MIQVSPGHSFVANQLYLWRDRLNHRAMATVSLAIALGCICGTAGVKAPLHKALLMSTATAASVLSLRSSKAHRFADVMVASLERASLDGWQQQAVQALMPTTKRGNEQPLEAEIIEEAPDQFLLSVAQMKDPVAIQICGALSALGVPCYCSKIEEGLAFDRYYLIPDDGIKASAVADKSKDLMLSGFCSEPTITVVGGAIAVDVARVDRRFANYADFIQDAPISASWMPIGLNQLTGELIGIDFADSNSPHGLIGGVTGGGKSELLRAAVRHLSGKDSIKLGLIDAKMSTWEDTDLPIVHNPVEAVGKLFKLVEHMETRRKVRSAAKCKDIATYNAQAETPLPRIIYFIEELKDLIDALQFAGESELKILNEAVALSFDSSLEIGTGAKQMKPQDALLMAIGRIGQAGRSEGIHLVVATQEPSKKLMDSLISNLPVKISLKMRSHVEAGLIQCPGADKLLGKGDLLLNVPGKSIVRCQSLYCD